MDKKVSKILLDAFFREKELTNHNLESFNTFVDNGLQKIVDENKEVLPDILPKGVNDLRIKLGNITLEKPSVKEADGTKRMITPAEARIRNLTYESPIYMEIIVEKDGIEEEIKTVHVGNMPIMVLSKFCHLYGKTDDELIEMGEDPNDPGGYFIINGTERIIIVVEDLAPNKVLVEKNQSRKEYVAKVFSDDGQYKILHSLSRGKDGGMSMNFTRVKDIPVFALLKALGFHEDQDIVDVLKLPDEYLGEIYINLYKISDLQNKKDYFNMIGKKMGITYSSQIRVERAEEVLDKFLFPHIGHEESDRIYKAHYLAKMVRKLMLFSHSSIRPDDKDHYKNKRLRLCREMMESLFRVSFRMFIGDMKYNFERLVKRGKLPSIGSVTRAKLLTSRIKSSLATGQWVGGRQGVSQHLERDNYCGTLAHLRRVASLLTSQRKNFKARDLHPSHYGRLCASETPDGTNVGLRKNLAILCEISVPNDKDDELLKQLIDNGMKGLGE
ncbi:DNA-directed RNA polymerase subunit B'' [archaeon CG07_land_8_20_14_0_80_38_8]|nr:MAG: DNA-directed RNA polymerase subunit B'' [archaeon CG07_land_8_20_14_0_80_38_8]